MGSASPKGGFMLPDRSTIIVFLLTIGLGMYSPWASVCLLVVLFLIGLATAFTLKSVVRKLMPHGLEHMAGKLSLMLLHGFMMQNTTGNTAVAFAPGADSGKSEVVRRLKSSAEIKQLGTFIGLLGPLPFFPALEVLKRLESR